MQAGGNSIKVWGIFTWHGLGSLVHLSKSLTGDCYISLYHDYLCPFIDDIYSTYNGLLQQENAPCYWVQFAQNWFEEYSEDICWMVWPSYLSNFNPIGDDMIGHSEEVYLYTRSCNYKYLATVDSYQDTMIQQFSGGLLITCGINTISSCCPSLG